MSSSSAEALVIGITACFVLLASVGMTALGYAQVRVVARAFMQFEKGRLGFQM
jgi:hypothetical protein